MVTASSAPARYTFQGRTVTMPVVVRDATSAAATYLVDARAARALLPGPELDVVELVPGRALLSVACIDYRDNDLGDYNEVSLAFFVRERRAPAGIPYLGTALDVLRGPRRGSGSSPSTRASRARRAAASGDSRRPSSGSRSRTSAAGDAMPS
jgi:hypothetical protein